MTEFLALLLAVLLLLGLDLAACAARMAYAQTSHARLLALRETMGARASVAVTLLPAQLRLRASLNLMLVTTRFLLAGVVLLLVALRPVDYRELVAFLALLVGALLLFWLEWVVERVVAHDADAWAVRLAIFARLAMATASILLVPLALSPETSSATEAGAAVTEDEVKTLVDAGQEEGLFELGERRMIHSIFDLGTTVAREIMVPRIDMLALEVNTPLPEAVDALLAAGHSRVPVYDGSIDHLQGLLYAKDLLRVWRETDRRQSLHVLLRPAYFVPEAKKLDALLAEMQSKRIHMAIVIDEYGGVSGLVTLEDIVEEILGEIQDEYDQGEEAPYQVLPDGSYLFLGRISLADFNEILGTDLGSEEADTLGGYIYSRIGRVPSFGDQVLVTNSLTGSPLAPNQPASNLVLTVEQVSARRIRKVSARWAEVTTGQEKDSEHVDG